MPRNGEFLGKYYEKVLTVVVFLTIKVYEKEVSKT